MRPWRTGTRSWSRVAFWASSNAIGSGRSEDGSQPSCAAIAASALACLPRARRSSTLGCMTFVVATLVPSGHGLRLPDVRTLVG